MSEYNMPPINLFGKRCRIKHVSDLKRGFVYRIVNSGVRSNYWKELPLGRYGKEAIIHDNVEDIVFVVCDTLIDEYSKIERVALKDIEIMQGETVEKSKIDKAIAEIENAKMYRGNPKGLPNDIGLDRYFDKGLMKAIEIIKRNIGDED